MERLVRLSQIVTLIDSAGGVVDGRKKLHKLAYLCQRSGTDLGQSFIFHMYGVYSPSLAQDIQLGEDWHVITEEVTPGSTYVISRGDEVLPAVGDNGACFDDQGFRVVRALAGESPSVLEVLTTVVYLWDAGYRERALLDKLRELKGHLSSQFDAAFRLAGAYFTDIRLPVGMGVRD